MSEQARRGFLKGVGAGTLACAVGAQAAPIAANERLVLGVIGPGGMGSNHVSTLTRRDDVEIRYVCDVDQRRLAGAAERVISSGGKPPQKVTDMRRVFEDPAVDAVFIATPDHWHAPAAILALDAGKHVYVEKPCCHNIREGRLLSDAVARSGKCLQVGTQSRSTDVVMEAIRRVQEGQIGDILAAKAWNSQRRGTIGHRQPSAPPDYLDFDGWVGPAPMVPYRSNLLPAIWRWWYGFGCGDIGNDGVHDIDVALWGLGVDAHPVRATCLGRKLFFDDDQQFPDTQYAVFDYAPNDVHRTGLTLIFEQRIWSPYVQEGYENGVALYGTNGVLIIGHAVGWRLYGPRNKLIAERKGRVDLPAHHANFLGCVRGVEKQLNADVAAGHRSATIVHLANIAARTGQLLEFDPSKEVITNDPEANAMIRRQYRDAHWAVPKGV